METSERLIVLQNQRIIPVIRLFSKESALFAGKTILRTGFTNLEVTLTTPGAFEVVKELKQEFPNALIGFGSVFSPKDIERGIKVGGDFFISPHLDEEILEAAKQNATLYVPGTMTPTEIGRAKKAGLKAVKIFPAEPIGGVQYIKSLQGPFPEMSFIPTGGINLGNLPDYLALKNVTVGATSVVSREAAEAEDTEATTNIIQSYLEYTNA